MSDTVKVAKPRQRIVRLAPVPPERGTPGVRVMLACGHVFSVFGVTLQAEDGTLECARCGLNEEKRKCAYCGEPLTPDEKIMERGENLEKAYHEECDVRANLGSAAHFMGECSCFGGTRSDPPGMSKRDSARLAFEARGHAMTENGGGNNTAALAALSKALNEGRVVDLGLFRVGDDGTLTPKEEGDDE